MSLFKLFMTKKDDKTIEVIEKTYSIVIENKINTDNLKSEFSKHISDNNKSSNKIFDMISDMKCPKGDTIGMLERRNVEQNGHLKRLSEQGEDTRKKLDAIINQTKGENRNKDDRRNMWTLVIAIIVCMITGIGVFLGAFFDLKKSKINLTQDNIKEIKQFIIENEEK